MFSYWLVFNTFLVLDLYWTDSLFSAWNIHLKWNKHDRCWKIH